MQQGGGMKNKVWSYENRMMAVLGLTFGFVFFDRNAMSYLAPFVALDLNLSNTQIGMLSSALSLTWALSGYALGALSDATGRRKSILVVAVVVFSLSSIGSGIATSFAVLLASRMLMGLSEGGILPISQSLVAMESSDKRRGLNMGVMQNFGSNLLGSFAAPLVLVAVASAYNWRVAFFVAAIPGLICALLVAKIIREPAAAVASRDTSAQAPARKIPLHELLRFRNMWLCILISCFMVAWMVLGWAFLPLFFVRGRGIAPSDMSLLMSVLGISATVCSFIVPGLSDRFGRKPVMIAFCLIGLLCPLAALHYTGSLWVLGALIFIGWSASGTFPIFMATIPSETIPAGNLARALGLVMGVGELSGGFLGPTLAGWGADRYGLQTPVLMMSLCALIAACFALFLKETAPVKVGRSAPHPAQAIGVPNAKAQ
jgi:MFS family permease